MTRQLPLPFALPERHTFERFIGAANAELISRLKRPVEGFECLWLFGEPGVGKTHLLQAACHHLPGSAYLPADVVGSDAALDGYRRFAFVGVDDIAAWLGARSPELAFIGLYNVLAEAGSRLVVGAAKSPRDVRFALPDLASRLRAAACYRVAPMTDADKALLVERAAAERGLGLGPEVVPFLLSRVSRDPRDLLGIVDRLDRSSLAAGRRVTVPFVKRELCL
jgi:DnaA family protein